MFRVGLLATRLPSLVSTKPLQNVQHFRAFRTVRNQQGTVKTRLADVKALQGMPVGLRRSIGPMEVGQAAVACGGALGLGALCFYGLGLSNEAGAIDRAAVWPAYVRARVRDTYAYFGASVAVVGASAAAVWRSPVGHRFFEACQRRPMLSLFGMLALQVGSSMAMQRTPYSEGLGAKQGLWLANGAVLGLLVSSLGVLGGPLLLRGACITGGVVGGLSLVAVCAPSERFLSWSGPLAIGFGGVLASSIGSAFLPPTSTLGLGLHAVALYGGLLLFSAMMLYDTQRIMQKAERHPAPSRYWDGYQWSSTAPYDPINASHRILMDALNIFVRIVQILAMGGGSKRR